MDNKITSFLSKFFVAVLLLQVLHIFATMVQVLKHSDGLYYSHQL